MKKGMYNLYIYIFNFCFLIFKILIFIVFPLPFSLLTPRLRPHNHHTVVHVHECFFLLVQSLHPLNYPFQLSSCSPFMSLSLFSLLVQFVYEIPHIGEIIWYFSFSDWLISLSIMFSRSIYTVTNGKIFFFHYGQVVFHCVNVPLCKCSCFIHSSTDGHLD